MPIPRAQQQVSPTGLPSVRVSDAYAKPGDAVPAVSAYSKQVADYAAEQKKQADDAATQEAWSATVQSRNRLTYDPNKGLVSLRGHAAMSAGGLLDAFDKETEGIKDGLKNDVQVAMYSKMRDKEREEFSGRIDAHVGQETIRIRDDANDQAQQTAVSDLIFNYRDPRKLEQTKQGLAGLVSEAGKSKGWDAETTKRKYEETLSAAHYGVVLREVTNDNYPAAQAWYEKVKKSGEVTGQDITKIEGMLQQAKKQHEEARSMEMANSVANDYLMKYSDEEIAVTDMEKEHGGEPYFKDASAEFRRRFKARETQDQFKTTDRAWSQLDAALKGQPIDPYVMSSLPMATRKKINEYSQATMKWTPEKVSASGDTYVFLMNQAANKPEAFMREDLIQYGLEPDLLKDMRNLQLGMRNKDGQAQEKVKGIISQQERVDMATRTLGYNPNREKEKIDAFNTLANKALLEFQRVHKKPPTDDEWNKVVDDLKFAIAGDKSILRDQMEAMKKLPK